MINPQSGYTAIAGNQRRLRVLFAGERPVRSAPTRTLAAAMEQYGFECRHGGDAFASTARWVKALRDADIVVLVSYGVADCFTRRQVALATAMGRPVVRWWVGTDVFLCLEDKQTAKAARILDDIISVNVAVAEHLVGELRSVRIEAAYVPSVVNLPALGIVHATSVRPQSLLVYLPSKRREFYGGQIVEQAVTANPDVKFLIVADDDHSLARYPNVQSLGWVDDMEKVWESVGGILRVTRHDGLPRMVLEALARGKFVLYSWPLEGCWLARTIEEVQAAIDRFKAAKEPNRAGTDAIRRILQTAPEARFSDILRETTCGAIRRARGIGLFTLCAAIGVLEKSVHRMRFPREHAERPNYVASCDK